MNTKVNDLEEKLRSNKIESDQKIANLQAKLDELTLSLDKNKLDTLKSIDTDDLLSLNHQKVKFHDLNKRLDSEEKKIVDLENSVDFSSKQSADLKTGLQKLHDEGLARDTRMNIIGISQGRSNNMLHQLQGAVEVSEVRQRKFNLVFEGVAEENNEDTKQVIINFLRKSSLASPPANDRVDTAYRLGRVAEGTTRSILVVFKDLHAKDYVLNNAPQIRKSIDSKTLWINRDHPELTRKQISNTRKCFNLMRSNNHPCKINGTSITFNNQVYHYKDLNRLPEGSRLEDTRLIPCSDGKGLCFQGPGTQNTQQAMSQTFTQPTFSLVSAGDIDKAQQILNNPDPLKAKQLGSQVTPKDPWLQNEEDTLKTIVTLKFKQNKYLGNRLKNSGVEHFYECTRDMRWGTGITIYSRQVDTSLFLGENKFGKILDKIKASW